MSQHFGTVFRPYIDNDPTLSAADDSSSPPSVDPTAPIQSGAPRYEVRSVLGRGGMGEVRLCRDGRMGRDVAVKVSLNASDATRARFMREALIQGQLEHPSIVPVHDLEILDDGSAYFAMKRVRGKTLAEILAEADEDKRAPLRKLLGAFMSVCLAVDFAHSKGVVHRDIKPGNIMLGDFGEVYLLDWGVAKVVNHDDDFITPENTPTPSSHAHTAEGSMLGTPGYMAPEQIDPSLGEVSKAADIYALGAVLFEILAGQPFIKAKDVVEATVLTLKSDNRHPALRAPERSIPAALDVMCARALSRDPHKRQSSVRELADAIDRYLAGEDDRSRRREVARLHVESAAKELAVSSNAARSKALSALGTAIALDPDNSDARTALFDLLTSPPQQMPAEVKERIADEEKQQIRYAAKLHAYTALIWFAFAPFCLAVGVRELKWFALVMAIIGVAAFMHWRISRSENPLRFFDYVALLVHLIGHLLIVRFAGWLVILPALLVAFSSARQTHPDLTYRRVSAGASVALLCVAFLVNLIDPAYARVDGGVLVQDRAMTLDAVAMVLFLAISIATIISPALNLNRTRQALVRAEEELHVQRWQLEQLVRKS